MFQLKFSRLPSLQIFVFFLSCRLFQTMRVMDDEICYRAKECQYELHNIPSLYSLYNYVLKFISHNSARSHDKQDVQYPCWSASNSLYTFKSEGALFILTVICCLIHWIFGFFFSPIVCCLLSTPVFSLHAICWCLEIYSGIWQQICFTGNRTYGRWCIVESK